MTLDVPVEVMVEVVVEVHVNRHVYLLLHFYAPLNLQIPPLKSIP